jgi:pilus assembly protein CpaB
MRRPGTIFMMSLVLGALFAAMVYRYLSTQRAEIEAARRAAHGATIEVMVASDKIPIGSVIEPGQVRKVAWPSNLKPEGAISNPDDVVGQVALSTLDKNQPVVKGKLVKSGAGLLPLLISEGMRGVSVKVDQVTGVSGFIVPNSRVDVLTAGSSDTDGERDERSKLILQNVRVLATGHVVEQQNDGQPKEVPTVTLLVNPEDAEKLTLASRQDTILLALRNYSDHDTVKTAGMSRRVLFAPDEKAQRPRARGRGRGGRGGPSVEVLLGEKLTRQPLL